MRRMRDERGRRASFVDCESKAMNRWGILRAQGHEVGHAKVVQNDVAAVKKRLRPRYGSVTGASSELREVRSLVENLSTDDDGVLNELEGQG